MLIGILGKYKAGKDTLYEILKQITDRPVFRYAFGDELKEEAAAAIGLTLDDINADKDRFRLLIQFWGTEWRRKQNRDYWVELLQPQVAECLLEDSDNLAVVTDVRFKNEAKMILDMGGMLVRIVRPLSIWGRIKKFFFGWSDKHASEIEADNITVHYTITNSGTKLDLKIALADWWTQVERDWE